jgi:HEAT repeat protein
MKSETSTLKVLLAKWRQWSSAANRSEDGWQACFPEWASLMTAASSLMTYSDLTDEDIHMVETCWLMSEEDEDLSDYAKSHLEGCWPTLLRLRASRFPEVRWQVYDVLGEAGNEAEGLLKQGLSDENAYCRRRAILSVAKVAPQEAKTIATRFVNDPDPYIRKVASELMDH